MTGISASLNSTAFNVSENLRAASRIKSQCDGTLTGSLTARLAPAAFALATARSTPAR